MRSVVVVLVVLASVSPGAVRASGDLSCELLWERPTRFHGSRWAAAQLGDFDGDGLSDILVLELAKKGPRQVVVFDGATGDEQWRSSVGARATVRVADVDSDGTSDVLAASLRELVVLKGGSGDVLRRTELRSVFGWLTIGFLDRDGIPDIIYSAGEKRNDFLVALSGADLTQIWSLEARPDDSRFGDGFGWMVARDLDGDGLDEVLVGENADNLVCVSSEGQRLWSTVLGERTKFVPKGALSCHPVVADVLGGGVDVIAVGCAAGALVVLDTEDGGILSRMQFGAGTHAGLAGRRRMPKFLRELLTEVGESLGQLTPVELDGKSGRELVFGAADCSLYAASPSSDETLWEFRTEKQLYDPLIPVDINEDGVWDLIGWDVERIYVLNGVDGSEMTGAPEVTEVSDVFLDDLDGDGLAELVVVGSLPRTVRAWTTGIPCSRVLDAPGCGE